MENVTAPTDQDAINAVRHQIEGLGYTPNSVRIYGFAKAILVKSTWTGSEYLYPVIFKNEIDLNKKLSELKEKCSTTNGIKNNTYSVIKFEYGMGNN